jgi:hypothetical protein
MVKIVANQCWEKDRIFTKFHSNHPVYDSQVQVYKIKMVHALICVPKRAQFGSHGENCGESMLGERQDFYKIPFKSSGLPQSRPNIQNKAAKLDHKWYRGEPCYDFKEI